MAAPYTYDPNQVSAIAGGKIVGGFGDGTYIETERDESSFMKKIGVDGEVSRAKNNNRGGKTTITLMQTSPSNDDLSAFQQADELSGTGIFTWILKDSNGSTILTSTDSWVDKPPKLVYAKEVQAWQWVINHGTLTMVIGAST